MGKKLPGSYHADQVSIAKSNVLSLVGKKARGWVKSFKDTWGLLNSRAFDGDLFFGIRANPQLRTKALSANVRVEFGIDLDSSRKAQAVNVVFVDPPQPQPQQRRTPGRSIPVSAAPLKAEIPVQSVIPKHRGSVTRKPTAEDCIGCQCTGKIRSFKGDWGFVVSESFEDDLFVHKGSNPNQGQLQEGDLVIFEVAQGVSGKCHALIIKSHRPSETPKLAPSALVGSRISGSVRSFEGTWGFIISPRFEGDLFVGLKENPQLSTLCAGDRVEFTVSKSGVKVTAMDVQVSKSVSQPVSSLRLHSMSARSRSPRRK